MCCNTDEQKKNTSMSRSRIEQCSLNKPNDVKVNMQVYGVSDDDKENEHRPLIQNAIKIKLHESNKENSTVQKVIQRIGYYSPKYSVPKSWQQLPELGPYLYLNGATYIGQYKNSLRHGEGRQVGKDGSIYEGQWLCDKRNGKGRTIYSDGDCYEGDWTNDRTEGVGKYLYMNGAYYEGEWVNNEQHGQGKEYFLDGSIYEGTYKEGVKNGQGVFIWLEGSKYTGEFRSNDLHGYGIIYYKV